MLAAWLTISLMNQPIPNRYAFTEIHMGGEVRITLYAESQAQAETAASAAYKRFAELEQIMSDYRPSSEVRQIKSLIPTKISRDLYTVIEKAQEISKRTDGAFDITAGPIVQLWRNARKTGRMPGPIETKVALKSVGYQNIALNPATQEITILKKGVAIDLGGIAKGHAADEAIKALKANGVSSALVQAGGDIVISDPPPNQHGWSVLIPGNAGLTPYSNCAISTSGDSEQFVIINGIRYSHIVDPRTGVGLTNQISATVIAESGLLSDPLATAFCVMGRGGVSVAKDLKVQLLISSE